MIIVANIEIRRTAKCRSVQCDECDTVAALEDDTGRAKPAPGWVVFDDAGINVLVTNVKHFCSRACFGRWWAKESSIQ